MAGTKHTPNPGSSWQPPGLAKGTGGVQFVTQFGTEPRSALVWGSVSGHWQLRHAEAANTGRTFVWVEPGPPTVVGYFTLAAHLVRKADVPKSVGHGSPEASSVVGKVESTVGLAVACLAARTQARRSRRQAPRPPAPRGRTSQSSRVSGPGRGIYWGARPPGGRRPAIAVGPGHC